MSIRENCIFLMNVDALLIFFLNYQECKTENPRLFLISRKFYSHPTRRRSHHLRKTTQRGGTFHSVKKVKTLLVMPS